MSARPTPHHRLPARGLLPLGAALAVAAAFPAAANPPDGRILYGNNTTTPGQRTYRGATFAFDAQASTVAGATPVNARVVAAPGRNEYLAGYVTAAGTLQVMRFDGTSWTNEWTSAVGGTGANGRRFDIAYEDVSGDAIVVYSRGASNNLGVRIWNGTAWTNEATFDSARITGTFLWVKLAPRSGSDEIAALLSDSSSDLTALVWNGSSFPAASEPSWTLETSLEQIGAAGDSESFDLAYESTSGDLLVVWGRAVGTGTNGVYYTTRSGAGSWAASATQAPTFADEAKNVDLAADPGSDRVLFASQGDNGFGAGVLQYGVWDGGAWVNATANADTSSLVPTAGSALVASGWLTAGATARGVIVYGDAANTALDWRTWTPGTGFSTQPDDTTSPAMGNEHQVEIYPDPANRSRLLVVLADVNGDLWAKALEMTAAPAYTWRDTEGGAALTATLVPTNPPSAKVFGFAHDRFAPVLTVGNGVDPASAPLCPGASARVDAFTLATNSGTDAVNGLTATLSPGSSSVVTLLEITDETGATVYGSAVPAGDAVMVTPLSPALSASPSAVQYGVRITAAGHALAPGSHPVGATVTAVTHTGTHALSYADSGSATLTIDNAPPAAATGVAATGGDASASVTWTNPAMDYSSALVVRDTAPISSAPSDGVTYAVNDTIGSAVVRLASDANRLDDTGLENFTTYHYRVFVRDACGNWSPASAEVTARPRPGNLPVQPLTPSAAAVDCARVDVTAPFHSDSDTNGNSSTSFARGTSAGGPFTPVTCNPGTLTGPTPRACTDTSVAASTAHFYEVTFSDPDGASPNPVYTGAVTTPRCGYTLTVAANGAVAATTPRPGDAGVVVGRLNLDVTAGAGPVVVRAIGVTNGGTALPGVDVRGLLLFLDANGNGAVDAAEPLVATSRWDAGRYAFEPLAESVDAAGRNYAVTLDVANGATAGRTFLARVTAANVLVDAPDVVSGGYTGAAGATIQAPAGGTEGDPTGGSTRPLAMILNPGSGTVVTGSFRVQVKVYRPGGIAGVTALQLSRDNGATWTFHAFDLVSEKLATTANYDPDTANAAVYEWQVPSPAPGTYALKARATDATGSTSSATVLVTVVDPLARPGDGNLLVRDDSSQLCTDCHALQTHSSQTVGNKYGAWATNCRDCHAPHGTPNIFLVRPKITPPAYTASYQPTKDVYFSTPQGDSGVAGATSPAAASHANADNTGPCQVCHTRTTGAGVARWRNTSNADAEHYSQSSSSGTQSCTGCHKHAEGFRGKESKGGEACTPCHDTIKTWMAGTDAGGSGAQPSRHSLVGFTDTWQDPAGSPNWSTVTYLTDVLPAQRTCVNTCHQDHVHNAPGQTTHDSNVHANASTQAGRAVTRDVNGFVTAGTPARTDFDPATDAGMCLSCHVKPASPAKPAIDGAAYDASAHEFVTAAGYTWQYTLHDGSRFDRNCTKCHASRREGTTPQSAGLLTAVHGTPDADLLAGVKNPATVNGTVDATRRATFVCYDCHGNAGVGANLSGKDIQSRVALANQPAPQSGHPSEKDAVHGVDPATGGILDEYAAAAFGNALGHGVGNALSRRHSGCLDCHDPHRARAGTHATPGNLAGPPLEGAWGARLSTYPARWAAPTSTNFTKVRIVAGTDVEATLCFKCHSAFYGPLPTAPSSGSPGFTETDTAREFNPNNTSAGATAGGFHPVLASAGSNLGATSNIKAPWTRTSLMTCSDCHESDNTTDPNGPHGSAAGFLLKGPNTLWSASLVTTATGMPAGTFCINCHNADFASSRFSTHSSRSDHRVACWNCHSAIPHGTARPGLLVAVDSTTYGDKTTDVPPWRQMPDASRGLYIVSYPSNNTTGWGQSNCGCGGTGH